MWFRYSTFNNVKLFILDTELLKKQGCVYHDCMLHDFQAEVRGVISM